MSIQPTQSCTQSALMPERVSEWNLVYQNSSFNFVGHRQSGFTTSLKASWIVCSKVSREEWRRSGSHRMDIDSTAEAEKYGNLSWICCDVSGTCMLCVLFQSYRIRKSCVGTCAIRVECCLCCSVTSRPTFEWLSTSTGLSNLLLISPLYNSMLIQNDVVL